MADVNEFGKEKVKISICLLIKEMHFVSELVECTQLV